MNRRKRIQNEYLGWTYRKPSRQAKALAALPDMMVRISLCAEKFLEGLGKVAAQMEATCSWFRYAWGEEQRREDSLDSPLLQPWARRR